jgi:5S rRNA maturation endonuclease (ribonuclease M5)
MGELNIEKLEYRRKTLDRLLLDIRDETIFVEGLRDKRALGLLGCKNVMTISGNLRKRCEELSLSKNTSKVIILTDMDRRGEQLAKAAKDECESLSLAANLDIRARLASLLGLRFFEDAHRKYMDLVRTIEEIER